MVEPDLGHDGPCIFHLAMDRSSFRPSPGHQCHKLCLMERSQAVNPRAGLCCMQSSDHDALSHAASHRRPEAEEREIHHICAPLQWERPAGLGTQTQGRGTC